MSRISLALLVTGCFLSLSLFPSLQHRVTAEKQPSGSSLLVRRQPLLGSTFSFTSADAFWASNEAANNLMQPTALASNFTAYRECPAETPLDCGNKWCCPRGYTMHCPRSTCSDVPSGARGCYNPDKLTPEQLAYLRNCCPELATCY